MNKEEFIKKYPSLENKIAVDNDYNLWIHISDVIETQLDKQKVKKAIEDIEKYMISLAYQKKGKKLIRVDINHNKIEQFIDGKKKQLEIE